MALCLCAHRTGHLIYLVIELFLCWSHLLVRVYTRQKYLHTLHSFGEIYPHASSLDAFLANFLIILISNFGSHSQSIDYCPWVESVSIHAPAISHESVNTHTFGYFSLHTKYKAMCSTWRSSHCEDFPSLMFFRVALEKDYNFVAVHSGQCRLWSS